MRYRPSGRTGRPHDRLAALRAEAAATTAYYERLADGRPCVCRHVTCQSRSAARLAGGRYHDGTRWVCFGCTPCDGVERAAATFDQADDSARVRLVVEAVRAALPGDASLCAWGGDLDEIRAIAGGLEDSQAEAWGDYDAATAALNAVADRARLRAPETVLDKLWSAAASAVDQLDRAASEMSLRARVARLAADALDDTCECTTPICAPVTNHGVCYAELCELADTLRT